MSAAPVNPQVSVKQYLAMNAKPAFEYKNGFLTQKKMPNFDHGLVQTHVVELANEAGPFVAATEIHVQIRPSEYLVPDVIVVRKGQIERPYPTKPVYLCIEVVSPDDSIRQLLRKCEEYHDWGVPHCWILDPQKRVAWQYDAGKQPEQLTAGTITGGEISLDLAAIFSVLDER